MKMRICPLEDLLFGPARKVVEDSNQYSHSIEGSASLREELGSICNGLGRLASHLMPKSRYAQRTRSYTLGQIYTPRSFPSTRRGAIRL